MPLIKNAKPGSKGFKQNIETEIKIGKKPPKQAVAIAYAESRQGKKKKKQADYGYTACFWSVKCQKVYMKELSLHITKV